MRQFLVGVGVFALMASAAQAADFRVYRANKLKQQDRIWVPGDAGKPGCHNLIITRRVYRVAQIGFDHCTIFAKKDCKKGTEMVVRWKNKKKPTTKITRGARWFLLGDRGSKMASWHCTAKKRK